MKVSQIRSKFIEFFQQRQHTLVDSSPLVPLNDPTLMFVNSGMVQFKDVFLGTDVREYKRALSVQACLRAGGKHNDLENVGYTARHHTFFEMLGNWSFGDYFKKEAIEWSWELLTQVYGLPAEKLLVTVYYEDDEAYDIWNKIIGVPAERIIRIADNKGAKYASDNFWMMADTGPCGPCTEIFYDHGVHVAGGPPGSPDEDGDRFIEIWNLVFMQFDMQPDGTVKNLPAGCVDTGMGLERLAAILQGVHSNYEIDLFQALIKAAARETGCDDLKHPSLKVIADHIRATSFMIVDGILPSNEGRGYVLRRIIRRAIRHGYKLGQGKPFFHKLVTDLVKEMGVAYPKLVEQHQAVIDALLEEEKRFFITLSNGMVLLEDALTNDAKVLSGQVAFKLHDTFGFPLDLSADICRERGVKLDEAGFEHAMREQKAMSRASGNFKMDRVLDYTGPSTEFIGEHSFEKQGAKVLAIFIDGVEVRELPAGQAGVVVLDCTPFYAERGGQVGDVGHLLSGIADFKVIDTQRIKATVWGHFGIQQQGLLRVGAAVDAQIDQVRRQAIMRNHSVTHMMHKALRDVLGTHVIQRGSLVSHDRTRFDFSHGKPMSSEEIRLVEDQVNREILANTKCTVQEMSLEDAKQTDAIMAFGERYGEIVRVVRIGSSCELCGGTHTERTGDVGSYKIVEEFGIAAGIRRIDAITGTTVLDYARKIEGVVGQLATDLKTPKDHLIEKVSQLQEHSKVLEKSLAQLKAKLASSQGHELIQQAIDINGAKLLVAKLDGVEIKILRDMVVQLKDKLGAGIVLLSSVIDGKVQIAVAVSQNLTNKVKAGELVNFVAQQVGGKGGGKPDLAMAGGTEATKLTAALASVEDWVSDKLG